MRSCSILHGKFDHIQNFLPTQADGLGKADDLVNVVFDGFQGFFPEQLHIFGSHEAAFGGDGVDEALFFQLVVGALGGDHADA